MVKGKKILISLGGTYEPIDSVRGITNKSSGKMGLALAKEAYIRGADLTLVVLLLFGGRKIPELMRGLGKGVKSFKQGMNEVEDELKKPLEDLDKSDKNNKSDKA